MIDIKPKIADEDYSCGTVKWKKGDVIGQWVILKKAFTPYQVLESRGELPEKYKNRMKKEEK